VFPDFFALFWKGGSPKERWNVLQKTLSRGNDDSNLRAGPTSACNHYSGRIKHLLTQYGPTVARLWSGDRKIRAAAETEVKKQQLTKWLASEHS
jgi:hypothetical protein